MKFEVGRIAQRPRLKEEGRVEETEERGLKTFAKQEALKRRSS